MEKRIFNKLIKAQMLSYGFEKTGAFEYAKESWDEITKVVVRVPEYDKFYGFGVGVQFKDFEPDYSDYSGKISKTCMAYNYPWSQTLLGSAFKKDYTELQIEEAVKIVMDSISVYLEKGREAIRENMSDWSFGIGDEKKENDIYAYFGMPLLDPYSDAYVQRWMENYKGGMKSLIALDEYFDHKDHYDKYAAHGCCIDIGKEFVMISYNNCHK